MAAMKEVLETVWIEKPYSVGAPVRCIEKLMQKEKI